MLDLRAGLLLRQSFVYDNKGKGGDSVAVLKSTGIGQGSDFETFSLSLNNGLH